MRATPALRTRARDLALHENGFEIESDAILGDPRNLVDRSNPMESLFGGPKKEIVQFAL